MSRSHRMRPDRRRAKLGKVVERDGTCCWICGREVRFDVKLDHGHGPSLDHVVRREDGGSNRIENLRLAHKACNMQRDRRKDKGRSLAVAA